MKIGINKFKNEVRFLNDVLTTLRDCDKIVGKDELKEFNKVAESLRKIFKVVIFIEDPANARYCDIYNALRPAFGRKIITEEKMKKLRKKYSNRMTL